MPLTNPANAINHLYPGIEYNQYGFRDDGAGVYLEYLDPSLGTPPTLAELEAAELAYVEPAAEADARASRGLNWARFVQELVGNESANSPYQQILEWGEQNGKARYNQILTQLSLVSAVFKSEARLMAILTRLKTRMAGDAFTTDQEAEIERLLTVLGVTWTWLGL